MQHDEDPTTEELLAQQERREAAEEDLAAQADLPEEEKLHEARADRAAYLAEKLAEQQAADQELEEDEDA